MYHISFISNALKILYSYSIDFSQQLWDIAVKILRVTFQIKHYHLYLNVNNNDIKI